MTINRRTFLQLGTLTLLAGCTPAVSGPGTDAGSSAPGPSTTTTGPTPAAPGRDLRTVPAPRFAPAPAPGGGIDGAKLDQVLAALPAYRGGALRRVVVRPGTYRRSRSLTIPSGVHLVAGGATFVSRVPGAQEPLVALDNVRDVIIEGGTWDGNDAKVTVITEWKHVIRIQNSTRVTLTGLITQHARGDGIYIGTHTTPCRDVTVDSVTSRRNYRNGLSVTSCDGLTCTDSIFTENGATSPLAGADIEPNHARAPIRRVRFTRCAFTDNAGRGFLVVMHPDSVELAATSIHLDQCTATGNAPGEDNSPLWAGITLIRPRGVTVTNSLLTGNNVGIAVQGRRGGDPRRLLGRGLVRLQDIDISDSTREGLLVVNGVRALEVERVRIFDSSRQEDGYFSGILLADGSNISLTDCVSSGARMFGLQASATVSKVTLRHCVLTGNEQGAMDIPKSGVKVVD
ncbi:hypothetical protein PROP_02313 [Propionicimonas sp. T2.31MG-18]